MPSSDLRKLVWSSELADTVYEWPRGSWMRRSGSCWMRCQAPKDIQVAGRENLADPNHRRAAARLGEGRGDRARRGC